MDIHCAVIEVNTGMPVSPRGGQATMLYGN